MARELRSPRTKSKRGSSLKSRFAEARWKIWRTRSKAEYARRLATIQEAADAGLAEAWEVLFEVHRKAGRRKLARDCAKRAFEQGAPDDVVYLAHECIYEDRHGTRAQQLRRGFDPKLGIAALEKRARADEIDCIGALSDVFRLGGPVPRDDRKSVYWLRRAARLGDSESMNNLGVRYRYGKGVRKNTKTAVSWYRKAAAASCSSGTHNLGLCYAKGEGVTSNRRAAVAWFRKAARLGNRSSMVRVADARIDGVGIPRDVKRGLMELRRLAKLGHPHALWSLGDRLVGGLGMRKEKRRGLRLLARAAKAERERERMWVRLGIE